MENHNGQIPTEILPGNQPAGGQDSPPPKRAPGLLVPVVLILIGIGLWFILFEVPRRAALSEFRAASAAYEETYHTYYNAVDAVNRKVLAWQKEVPALESSCASLEQLLTTGEPLRTKDADDARALLKEAEKIQANMPLSEPVITMQTWNEQGLSTEELREKRKTILNETDRISREIPHLEEAAAKIVVPDFPALSRRFAETKKMLEDSIALRQKIGISLDEFEGEIRIYDPFDNLEVSFEGVDPEGRIRLDKRSTAGVDREYAFRAESNSGLKNGDKVKVTVDFGDSMESFNQNLAAQYRTVISEWAKEYTVKDLPFSLTSYTQIDDLTLNVIKEKAVETIIKQAEQKEGLVTVDKVTLLGHSFLSRRGPTTILDSTRNYLFLIYSVKCTVDLSPDGHNYRNTVNYVTSVRFSDLLGMPDGKTALSLENPVMPSSSITLNTGVPTLLVFLPRTFQFAGYEDTDTLFYNEVASLTDKFNCESSIGMAAEAVPLSQ